MYPGRCLDILRLVTKCETEWPNPSKMSILPSHPLDSRPSRKISDTVHGYHVGAVFQTHQSVLHRGMTCAAPLLLNQWPDDAVPGITFSMSCLGAIVNWKM